ncbi:hypothetical protein DITRI_Ditri03aG0190400 [Diplodiscus trichospermus]
MNLYKIKFPFEEVGLPEDSENFSSATSIELAGKVVMAFLMLQTPMEKVIGENRPGFLVADFHYFWASDLALELGIPRLVFHPRSYSAFCAEHSISTYAPHKKVQSDKELFVLPGLPDEIQMTSLQLPDWIRKPDYYTEIINKIEASEKNSYGILVNSFYELEKDYAHHYKNVVGNRACYYRIQIALALESLDQTFIWVVREADSANDTKWLPERFEGKMRERNKSLIIRGSWAPQLMILDHPATGGFLTHCGWNSILESINLGVPMVTWPLSAEQFYNEKLVTRVLRIGVEVGVESWTPSATASRSFVEGEKIEKAVSKLMTSGEEAVERRKRAKEFSDAAKGAVKEGGSSSSNLTA